MHNVYMNTSAFVVKIHKSRKIEKEIAGIKKHTSFHYTRASFPSFCARNESGSNSVGVYSDNSDDDDKDGAEVAWMSGRVVDRLEM